MALTKTQRAMLTEVVGKLERGPYRGWDQTKGIGGELTVGDVRLWLETWVTAEIQQVLDNDAGRRL